MWILACGEHPYFGPSPDHSSALLAIENKQTNKNPIEAQFLNGFSGIERQSRSLKISQGPVVAKPTISSLPTSKTFFPCCSSTLLALTPRLL